MRIIEDKNKKKTIILDDGDTLEISSLKRNKEKIIVKCLNSTLHIDELTTHHIKNMNEEEIAIQAMKDYLDKTEDD